MKVSELTELTEQLYVAPAKLKKVKSFLTPEVAAKHHDLICQYIAKFVPANDLDSMKSDMEGGPMEGESVEFYLKLIAKQLPPEANAELTEEKRQQVVRGGLKPIIDNEGRQDFTCYFIVSYEKSMWQVWHNKVGWRYGNSTKRFDSPKDVTPYLLKVFASFEKLRKEMKAKYEGK